MDLGRLTIKESVDIIVIIHGSSSDALHQLMFSAGFDRNIINLGSGSFVSRKLDDFHYVPPHLAKPVQQIYVKLLSNNPMLCLGHYKESIELTLFLSIKEKSRASSGKVNPVRSWLSIVPISFLHTVYHWFNGCMYR